MYPVNEFQRHVLTWFTQHGRKHLPWQQQVNAYRVWVSEIMLQQTQVATVIDYFNRFMQKYPNVTTLAQASLDDVLHLWTGLGYYSRARNLHKAAQIIVNDHDGIFPDTVEQLEKLPGIGRSTAGAIVSLAWHKPAAILDGNVKRVFCRVFAIEGWYGESKVLKQLWEQAELYKPKKDIAAYNQALMDLGAMVCTRSKPKCNICPLQKKCVARLQQLTDQLPHKKPKKILPVRQTTFLIISNQQKHILLQQRPPAGIWGGLWCFPETNDSEMDTATSCAQQLGLRITKPQLVKQFRHTFSHYHLDITAVTASMRGQNNHHINEAKPLLWYDCQHPPTIGLAAPVKKLLEHITEELA